MSKKAELLACVKRTIAGMSMEKREEANKISRQINEKFLYNLPSYQLQIVLLRKVQEACLTTADEQLLEESINDISRQWEKSLGFNRRQQYLIKFQEDYDLNEVVMEVEQEIIQRQRVKIAVSKKPEMTAEVKSKKTSSPNLQEAYFPYQNHGIILDRRA